MKQLLKLEDVTKATGLAESTIYKFMRTQGFPKPIKLGASARWSPEAVEAFIASRQRGTAATRAAAA